MNISIAIIIILLVATNYFLIYRNYKVYILRNKIIDLCSEYNSRHIDKHYPYKFFKSRSDAYAWFLNKYSYIDMTFSFKKLELECWYTKEEISKLKN
jgi:hypothetical protein